MIIGKRNSPRRTLYAWCDNDVWMASVFKETVNGRRPIALFGSKEEIETTAAERGFKIEWLD